MQPKNGTVSPYHRDRFTVENQKLGHLGGTVSPWKKFEIHSSVCGILMGRDRFTVHGSK